MHDDGAMCSATGWEHDDVAMDSSTAAVGGASTSDRISTGWEHDDVAMGSSTAVVGGRCEHVGADLDGLGARRWCGGLLLRPAGTLGGTFRGKGRLMLEVGFGRCYPQLGTSKVPRNARRVMSWGPS